MKSIANITRALYVASVFLTIQLHAQQNVTFCGGSTLLRQHELGCYAATNTSCNIIYIVSNRTEHISAPIRSPLQGKYLFKSKHSAFRLELKNDYLNIEEGLELIRLVHLQSQTNHLIIITAPLPLDPASHAQLQAKVNQEYFQLIYPYLDTRYTIMIPGIGKTNISGQIRVEGAAAVLDWMDTDAMKAWRVKWNNTKEARTKHIQQLRESVNRSENVMKIVADAKKEEGLDFPAIDQAVWGVMVRYERATLQELDRVYRNVERQEQARAKSSLSPYSYSSRNPAQSSRTPPISELDKVRQGCEAIKDAFARHNPDAAYLAASLLLQQKVVQQQLNQEINQAVIQGLDVELRTLGQGEPLLKDCKVYAPGVDGKKVLVMEWSANKP